MVDEMFTWGNLYAGLPEAWMTDRSMACCRYTTAPVKLIGAARSRTWFAIVSGKGPAVGMSST